ncbi:cytochrome c oxidase subunit II [Luteimonas sp. M1R5S18]|uniref:Cytochrome c oxidase subunit 2 n=1 Tax=Luteimonas rhizosphaericola TaxID=3042024 RepID=A0ABT6JK76_9GAMM|nr:cytochrome c oxidase subunit II [Luteimonas rhizosphaericola]MDH5830937.1 cytochrome c oxidase subunit II [Luteimonas rhizosphaericola]
MMQARFSRWGLAVLASLPMAALAADAKPWQLNMGRGVTTSAQNAYEAHMLALWICVAIGVIVFAAMGVAMYKFRHSRGAVPDTTFTHSTKLEILWTVVPIILLVIMAVPATAKLVAMYDTRESEMTIKVTGIQWMWKYEYLGEGVELTSRLDRESDRLRQSGERPDAAANPHYLLEVDNELVVPTDTKIRFVITADDVIHAWWVPALGWKQDAIPGLINEAWTEILEPGVYRGQCAELCGKDHGFMPIVVRAVPRAEFDTWLAARKAEDSAPADPSQVPEGGDGTSPRSVDPDMIEDVQQGEEPAAPQATDAAAPADAPSAG